jgi:hypothetical protein
MLRKFCLLKNVNRNVIKQYTTKNMRLFSFKPTEIFKTFATLMYTKIFSVKVQKVKVQKGKYKRVDFYSIVH